MKSSHSLIKGAQKVLPCLEGVGGGSTQGFRPAIFPFCGCVGVSQAGTPLLFFNGFDLISCLGYG